MKYRKKPVVIEAYQTDTELNIETLEGTMHASAGDYIITGVNGEQYPCKPDIFKKTYEEICDEEASDEDSVSRQAAINAADRADYTGLAVEDVKNVTDEVVKEIKKLPSAQPERKKGKWIDEKINSYTSRTYCSECGNSAPFICVSGDYYGRNMHGETKKTNFCPNCGAKMDVADKDVGKMKRSEE